MRLLANLSSEHELHLFDNVRQRLGLEQLGILITILPNKILQQASGKTPETKI